MTSLDGLRALEQAATPGPWYWRGRHWPYEDREALKSETAFYDAYPGVQRTAIERVRISGDEADAALIVAARNALPGLLDRVAAAEAERDALRTALARAGVPLEVLRLQIEAKPYRELTRDFQRLIVDATEVVRSALAASVPSGPAAGGDT